MIAVNAQLEKTVTDDVKETSSYKGTRCDLLQIFCLNLLPEQLYVVIITSLLVSNFQ